MIEPETGCFESWDCKVRGLCTPVEDDDGVHRRCIAVLSNDCRRGAICQESLQCTAKDGECVAGPHKP